MEKRFTYEDGYEDGCNSKQEEILEKLDNLDLCEGYDYHTIKAIEQIIKDEEVTHMV